MGTQSPAERTLTQIDYVTIDATGVAVSTRRIRSHSGTAGKQ